MIQPLQQSHDLLFFASSADFENLAVFQITENRGIAVPFLDGKFINTEIPRGWQLAATLQTQPSLLQLRRNLIAKTVPSKTGANLFFVTHLRYRLCDHVFANRLTQPPGRPSTTPTRHIRLRKGLMTVPTGKTTFVEQELHLVFPQTDISFDSDAAIMNGLALLLARGAGQARSPSDHLGADLPIP